MIKPLFAVPPQAQYAFSLCARSARSVVFSSMPSMTVVGLPNFLVSRRMRIRCCSFSISPQTHKSFGSPHVGQTSAMTLKLYCMLDDVYKSFNGWCVVNWGFSDAFRWFPNRRVFQHGFDCVSLQ